MTKVSVGAPVGVVVLHKRTVSMPGCPKHIYLSHTLPRGMLLQRPIIWINNKNASTIASAVLRIGVPRLRPHPRAYTNATCSNRHALKPRSKWATTLHTASVQSPPHITQWCITRGCTRCRFPARVLQARRRARCHGCCQATMAQARAGAG